MEDKHKVSLRQLTECPNSHPSPRLQTPPHVEVNEKGEVSQEPGRSPARSADWRKLPPPTATGQLGLGASRLADAALYLPSINQSEHASTAFPVACSQTSSEDRTWTFPDVVLSDDNDNEDEALFRKFLYSPSPDPPSDSTSAPSQSVLPKDCVPDARGEAPEILALEEESTDSLHPPIQTTPPKRRAKFTLNPPSKQGKPSKSRPLAAPKRCTRTSTKRDQRKPARLRLRSPSQLPALDVSGTRTLGMAETTLDLR